MKINEIFPSQNVISKDETVECLGSSDDTRVTKRGDVFFLRQKGAFDIVKGIPDVVDKVAAFVGTPQMYQRVKPLIGITPFVCVHDVEAQFYRVVELFYPLTDNGLIVTGVTGTNGKTTLTHLVFELLRSLGCNAGLIGTIQYNLGGVRYKASHTTPDFLTLRKLIDSFRRSGGQYVVMEVSSHGIAQQRVRGITFSGLVFTNLTRDHLDYHQTMDTYFAVKRTLFIDNPDAFKIINRDDTYGKQLCEQFPESQSYSLSDAGEWGASSLRFSQEGTTFQLRSPEGVFPVKTALLGRFNVANLVAAIAVLHSLQFSLSDILVHIAHLTPVEGRMEAVIPGVFVDYAHTPDSLHQALAAMRDMGYSRVICVFGCGGGRDRGKRVLMGQVAARYADFSIVTADNPRNEDVNQICRDIAEGFLNQDQYTVIPDRSKAIAKGLEFIHKTGKVGVLVAGKGHEKYQIVGEQRITFHDVRIIEEITNSKKFQRRW